MNKLYVTITIDTENSQKAITSGKWVKDTMIEYCQGTNWGIRYILKMLDYYNVVATWYLSIFEKYLFGEKLMASVCDLLMTHNQDIQLHTHPVWLMDPIEKKRVYMHQYSGDEQIYIINKGIEDVYCLTGEKPIAHRAGGYGVNKDTFIAINQCGLKIDSSIFYKNKVCKIHTSGIINKISDFMNVIEIPVSVCKRSEIYPFSKWNNTYKIEKVDINRMNGKDIINIFKDMLRHGGGYINLFMHSGSFYRFFERNGLNTIEDVLNRNDTAVRNFQEVLQYINRTSGIEIVTVPTLYEKFVGGEVMNKEYIPRVSKMGVL
ncbi:MAG: hypothetical protein HDR06_17095 [Lachnospiraceae bacterium]|nr:hypothetical protein [Lachnospiraceae bacterium]